MAKGDELHGKGESDGEAVNAFSAFLAELATFAPEDAERFERIEENIAKGSVDADLSFLVRYLTEKQTRYLLHYVETDGDFKSAAQKAGYAASVKQDQLEEGPAMCVVMRAAKAMVARRILQRSPDAVKERVLRIALKAEASGNLDTALRANVKLGEALGIFETKGTTVNVNAEGAIIQIGSVRAPAEDEDPAMDAVWKEIEAENYGVKALPQDGVA